MTATKFTHIAKPVSRRAILQDNRHTLCGRLTNRWNTRSADKATCTRCVAESLVAAAPVVSSYEQGK